MALIKKLPSINGRWSKVIIFFFASFLLNLLNAYFFDWFRDYLGMRGKDVNEVWDTELQKILVIIFFAPLIETLIFQTAQIELFLYLFKKKWISMLLSASVFASIHYYDILYIVMTFVGGIILSLFYIYAKKLSTFTAFFLTFLLHLTHNLYGLLFVNTN